MREIKSKGHVGLFGDNMEKKLIYIAELRGNDFFFLDTDKNEGGVITMSIRTPKSIFLYLISPDEFDEKG